MTIFDLDDIDDVVLLALVEKTLERHPVLRRIYDQTFVARLVRRRPRITNFLLLLLVRSEDDYAEEYWNGVVDDLLLLEPEESFAHFGHKLRMRARRDLESGRSELALAARLKRLGATVALEVPTRNGRNADIGADTTPKTWWEVKAVSDLDFVVNDDEVGLLIQQGLRRIDAPYVLTLDRSTVAKGDVARAVKVIKGQIAEHYSKGGALPAAFEALGLRVKITASTKQRRGYLGVTTNAYTFGDEQSERIRDRIVSAVSQLPDEGGGVVVIDSTDASWVDADDVIDACFGATRSFYSDGRMIDVHDAARAAFHPQQRTRVSAIVHYSRHPAHVSGSDETYNLYVVHNPFARVPLANDVFAGEGVLHCRAEDNGNGGYTIRKGITGSR